MTPEFLDLATASQQFSLSRSTLKNWIRSGRLRGYRLGKRKYGVKPDELRSLITEYQLPAEPITQKQLSDLCDRAIAQTLGPDWRDKLQESRRQARESLQ